MYQVNDIIMYKREVCRIIQRKEKYYKDQDYYELVPLYDDTLKLVIPSSSPFLRRLITKEKIQELIKKIPSISIIENDSRMIENEYKTLILSEDYEDLIRIIKTTYLRNKERTDHHKKMGDKDLYYFNKAEAYLYQEFAIVLNMSVDEVKDYIIQQINNLEK